MTREWDARSYEEVARPQLDWGRRLLDRRAWRGDEVVLDAGCGSGRLTEEVLHRIPRGRLVAVDLDPGMVRLARIRLAHAGARVEVHHGDVQHAERLGPVDVVFSNAVLHWVPDLDATYRSFFQALKPGGELLLQYGGQGNLALFLGLVASVEDQPHFAGHFRGWGTPWRFEDVPTTLGRLARAGFYDASARLDPAPTVFPHRAAFGRFVATVPLLPHLHRLPESMRAPFTTACLAAVEAHGSGWVLDYVRLTVRGRRPPGSPDG